jgi:Winged helix DNA-binding domain
VIPSTDYTVFVRGCARREARSADWFAKAGIPMGPVNRVINAVPDVLDQPLTRREIAARVSEALHLRMKGRAGRGWGGVSDAEGFVLGRHVLSVQWMIYSACMRGLACFGPMRGNETTFVRPDRWLPTWRDLSQAEAERELLRRYLRAHGPATVADFAMWTYMKAADARQVWASIEDELSPLRVRDRVGWLLRSDLPSLEDARLETRSVRLLPSFDSLLLGLKDKSHLVDAEHYKRVYRPQGWLSPVVLVDGRVAGIWSHEVKGRTLSVRIEAFRTWRRDVLSQIRDEVDDLGLFFDASEAQLRLARRR